MQSRENFRGRHDGGFTRVCTSDAPGDLLLPESIRFWIRLLFHAAEELAGKGNALVSRQHESFPGERVKTGSHM